MDKKSIIGLVLIGLILSVFTIVNQPTAEEKAKLAKEAAKKEAVADVKAKEADKKEVKALNNATVQAKHVNPLVIEKGELVRLENEKLIVDFSTQGGKVAAVYLKEFQSYKDFAAKKSKKVPLKLFQDGDASNELVFPINGKDFRTGKLAFEVKSQTKNSIVLAVSPNEGQSIEYIYKLNKNAYDLDYTVNLKGFEGKVTPQNIELKWKTAFRKTERLFKSQRMVSTVCFMNEEKGLGYLSETADDFQEAEENIKWVAFKQSYFSSILRPEGGFGKSGSKFNIKTYKENDERIYSHLKDYTATVNLNVKNAGNASVRMNWYFGPNDFRVLKSYGKGYDDIINFGWGLFRWINMYAVEPIFSLFTNAGVGIGVAILLLTLVLKLILMPIQWKMYVSSAKMRILKPEIDELNAKFPDKEDEMMALYRESGASPLAGCIPMLIQMPILLAVFRFFPAAFEMRQQPFLWAEDLSSFDSIWNFGVSIWPYGDHMSLFTLLMAATTLVYTYLNSGNVQQPQQPGMPNMKVIMYIFPVMMIFIFNDYSAGLSYYYFISTLISILLMVAIKQFFVDEEKLKAKMAAKKLEKSTTVKKKSKFQERLEQMQKLQQEQKNARKK